ncbi:MAG TPA: tetratricopeptide repeat protein [Rhodocyclaceae bacterium]|nr:tetratricopeptide repeat protein [Rhodocyclaceae bacterium]
MPRTSTVRAAGPHRCGCEGGSRGGEAPCAVAAWRQGCRGLHVRSHAGGAEGEVGRSGQGACGRCPRQVPRGCGQDGRTLREACGGRQRCSESRYPGIGEPACGSEAAAGGRRQAGRRFWQAGAAGRAGCGRDGWGRWRCPGGPGCEISDRHGLGDRRWRRRGGHSGSRPGVRGRDCVRYGRGRRTGSAFRHRGPGCGSPGAEHPKPGGVGTSRNAYREAARRAFAVGDIPWAIHYYREHLAKNPRDPDAMGELGNIYYRSGDLPAAAGLYYDAARILIERGNPGKASQLLLPVSEGNPALADDLYARLMAARAR